jgi:hypothetical protein
MQPAEIFFSYAHEDEDLMHDVRRQLIVYDRQKLILKWYDRLIPPGGVWAAEIDERLRQARIILLFVSPHFIESQYCYHVEMTEALRRHEAGQAVVIPIILRPCPWQDSPIGHLQALPKDGKAVTLWSNRDEACLDVAQRVMRVVRGVDEQNVAPAAIEVSRTETSQPSWPEKQGVFIADSSEAIPPFPGTLSGYRSEENKDFWGNTFTSRGTLRIFDSDGWAGIPDFPNTQNSCSAGIFMIRWRSAYSGVRIASTVGYSPDVTYEEAKIGSFGYMSGTNCEQPLFRFADTPNSSETNLVDIYYELRFWQAAP